LLERTALTTVIREISSLSAMRAMGIASAANLRIFPQPSKVITLHFQVFTFPRRECWFPSLAEARLRFNRGLRFTINHLSELYRAECPIKRAIGRSEGPADSSAN